ncbi:MAG TPA: SPOR domain-containing protein [Candidatus Sulfotelmatobacter sp.]|jgi:DedD protein|nr:SPOR domain-containing protein [Candidatus Sulfotelmatobacter sp.]
MRFEIRAGGGFLILVGLVGLSAGVFGLGLVAGYEMARGNTPDLNQISSTYPLPSPPEKPAPVSEMSSSAVASPAIASPSVASAPAAAPIKPPAPEIGEASPAARTSPATVARLKPPAEAPAASRTATDEDDTDDDSETAAAPPAPPPALPPGTRGFNIQIQALMDKSAADEMVSKLKRLGYNGQESKVAFNGQTWYRVRVGPYPSADEANAAQARLHDQLKQDYSTP